MVKEGVCKKCAYFLVHDVYNYLGLCKKEGKLMAAVEKQPCENFEETSLENIKNVLRERGWVYCLTCKKPIYSVKELEEHVGDFIASEHLEDEVASEEAPSAD